MRGHLKGGVAKTTHNKPLTSFKVQGSIRAYKLKVLGLLEAKAAAAAACSKVLEGWESGFGVWGFGVQGCSGCRAGLRGLGV